MLAGLLSLAADAYEMPSYPPGLIVVWILLVAVLIAGMWKAFVKAGKPGWAAIIPIYNMIVMLEIAGKPLWWIVWLFIPIANFVVFIILVPIAIARSFGKGDGFGVGLGLLGFVFWPILGFGDAKYQGPKAAA